MSTATSNRYWGGDPDRTNLAGGVRPTGPGAWRMADPAADLRGRVGYGPAGTGAAGFGPGGPGRIEQQAAPRPVWQQGVPGEGAVGQAPVGQPLGQAHSIGQGAAGQGAVGPAPVGQPLGQGPVGQGAVGQARVGQDPFGQQGVPRPGAAEPEVLGYGRVAESGRGLADSGTVAYGTGPAAPAEPRPSVDAARLWSGGLATAVVAALIGLVGVLVVRAVFNIALYAPAGAAALGSTAAVTTLCLVAAGAALAATGLAQLLIVSTPRPLAYLGWIVGLATATAAVDPLLRGLTAGSLAAAVIHLVIGLAIGSLVAGSAAAATRPARRN